MDLLLCQAASMQAFHLGVEQPLQPCTLSGLLGKECHAVHTTLGILFYKLFSFKVVLVRLLSASLYYFKMLLEVNFIHHAISMLSHFPLSSFNLLPVSSLLPFITPSKNQGINIFLLQSGLCRGGRKPLLCP